jgi:flagellar motor switch protein FliM
MMRWQPGSKLLLDRRHDEPIDVLCGDLPVLRTRIAEKDGRIALHVEERRFADDWPTAANRRQTDDCPPSAGRRSTDEPLAPT